MDILSFNLIITKSAQKFTYGSKMSPKLLVRKMSQTSLDHMEDNLQER